MQPSSTHSEFRRALFAPILQTSVTSRSLSIQIKSRLHGAVYQNKFNTTNSSTHISVGCEQHADYSSECKTIGSRSPLSAASGDDVTNGTSRSPDALRSSTTLLNHRYGSVVVSGDLNRAAEARFSAHPFQQSIQQHINLKTIHNRGLFFCFCYNTL